MGKINTNNYPNRPVSDYQDDDMFILQDNGGETYTTNVGDIKNLADSRIKLEGVKVNGTDLPITDKKVNVDISGKTDLSVIAYTFNSEMGYFKGAYVTYNGKLYEFIQEHTGAWNPSHVREIKATGRYVRAGNGGYNNGDRATCEGYMTKASGNYSHAEGRETQAVGDCTHAEGRETIANGIYQHVEGKYNIADNESKYIHIIGNGTDDNNRSNAMTLDWEGNLEVSGDVKDGNGEKISDKADKVTNATSGHLAGLDSNGNLTDSGVSPTEDVTVEGSPVTFDSPFEQDAKSVVVSVKPIQDLHGYDAPWVGGAGKNKANIADAQIQTADYIYEDVAINDIGGLNAGTYTISFDVSDFSEGSLSQAILLNSDGTQTESIYISLNNGRCSGVITTNFVATKMTIYSNSPTGCKCENVQIEAGSTATSFAPYSNICPISGIDEVEIEVSDGESEPTTTIIPLPSTLYGGTVDVTEGSADSRYGYIASYNGETLPGAWISDRDVYTGSNSPTTGAEVCYELATPTTLSLTPTDIELLEGTNVVSTNGEKVAVTYGRSLWQDIDKLKNDTEGKLDKSDVATIEGDTASKAYSVNDFMLRADGLYKVTQPIAQNASITASNTTKTTIGAVLTALLNA